MTKYVTLTVNGVPIPLDYFVEGFIDHTVEGMISSLEGVGTIKTVDISIDGDMAAINVNGTLLPINQFVNKLVRSTIIGIVSNLKGVSEIKRLKIDIRRQIS